MHIVFSYSFFFNRRAEEASAAWADSEQPVPQAAGSRSITLHDSLEWSSRAPTRGKTQRRTPRSPIHKVLALCRFRSSAVEALGGSADARNRLLPPTPHPFPRLGSPSFAAVLTAAGEATGKGWICRWKTSWLFFFFFVFCHHADTKNQFFIFCL